MARDLSALRTREGKAILVVKEVDGTGGNVRRHGARLAQEGYFVAAVDMHGAGRPLEGKVAAQALAAFDANLVFPRRA